MHRALTGILAPVITPFTEDGAIDRAGLERNIGSHVDAGLDGIVLAGSTGEAALLDECERREMTSWARGVIPREQLLVVGAGAESTRQAIRFARNAAEDGADAVLVVAPHYYGGSAMTSDALYAHYTRVAEASPVPVVLYNIPRYAHFVLNPELVHALSRHANIVGIKDSSGDLSLLSTYLSTETEQFAVLTGNAQSFLPAIEAGAVGAILAAATFAPSVVLDVWHRAAAGDREGALAAQALLTPLGAGIVAGMGVAGVKAAHDAVGLSGGDPRPPLLPVTAEQRQRVATLLEGAGVAIAA